MSETVSLAKQSVMHNSFGSPPASICMNLWTALNSDSDSLTRQNISVNSSQRVFTSLLSEQLLKKKNHNDVETKQLLENMRVDCDRQRSILLDFDKDISVELNTKNDRIHAMRQTERQFRKNVESLEQWEEGPAGEIDINEWFHNSKISTILST